MIDKICMIVPTRQRLGDFQIFANSWKKTTTGDSVVVVGIDDDDNTYDDMMANNKYPLFIYERVKSKPYLHILNELSAKYALEYNFIGLMQDDNSFNTPGWELKVINKLKELGDNGMVWTNDLIVNARVPTQPFMSSSIVRRLGHMAPPGLNCQLADGYWNDLRLGTQCFHAFPNIIIEHRHYSTGKRLKGNTSYKVQLDSANDHFFYHNSKEYKNILKEDLKKLNLMRD